MSDLLRELWSRAECEEPVFSAEEVGWAPPGQFELLCNLGLLKETDRATWARCEACGEWDTLRSAARLDIEAQEKSVASVGPLPTV